MPTTQNRRLGTSFSVFLGEPRLVSASHTYMDFQWEDSGKSDRNVKRMVKFPSLIIFHYTLLSVRSGQMGIKGTFFPLLLFYPLVLPPPFS